MKGEKKTLKLGDSVRIINKPNGAPSELIGATGQVVVISKNEEKDNDRGSLLVQLDTPIKIDGKYQTCWWVSKYAVIPRENTYYHNLRESRFIGGNEVLEIELPHFYTIIEQLYEGVLSKERERDNKKEVIKEVIEKLKQII